MKKLINLAGILSLFLLFSCSNLIENKNTSVRVVLPEAENSSRSADIYYDISSVSEYSISVSGNNFSEIYNRKPGEELVITDMEAGDYSISGLAKTEDGNVIGYGITTFTVEEEIETEVVLSIKKNLISNIEKITPTQTIDKITIDDPEQDIMQDIFNDLSLELEYKSGYKETVLLEELIKNQFFYPEIHIQNAAGEEIGIFNEDTANLVISVSKLQFNMEDILRLQEDPEALYKYLSGLEYKEMFKCQYKVISNLVTIKYSVDPECTYLSEIIAGKNSDVDLPTLYHSGYEFIGWNFKHENITDTYIGTSIEKSQINNYTKDKGHFIPTWVLSDITQISPYEFEASKYENGYTICYQIYAGSLDVDMNNLVNCLQNFKTCNPELKIILDISSSNLTNLSYTNPRGEPVTNTFEGFTNLYKIKMPSGMEDIYENCFKNTGITEISIPMNVSYIDKQAFGYCNYLKKVEFLGTDFALADENPFEGCFNIESFIIPDSHNDYKVLNNTMIVSKNEEGLYVDGNQKSNDTKIIPEGIVQIFQYVYSNSCITNFVISDSVNTIWDYAFYNCSNANIEISKSVNSIYPNAFNGCTSSKITFDFNKHWYETSSIDVLLAKQEGTPIDNVQSSITTADMAFYTDMHVVSNVSELLEMLTAIKEGNAFQPYKVYLLGEQSITDFSVIKAGLNDIPSEKRVSLYLNECANTTIPNDCFSYKTCLEYVSLPNGLTTIPEEAFMYCSNLIGIYLPSGVEEIEQFAFAETGLTEITIPASVKKIGGSVITNLGTGHYTFEDSDNWQYYYNEWQDCLDDEDLKVKINEGKPLRKTE